MTDLIANLSTGKGTWGHVNRLIQDGTWEKVILVTNEFGKENFTPEKPVEFIIINANKSLKELKETLNKELKEKIKGTEIALNMISGTGKEHIALLSAVLKLGVGIRQVALTKEGIEEF